MSNQVLVLTLCLAATAVYYWKQLVTIVLVGLVAVLLVGAHEVLALLGPLGS